MYWRKTLILFILISLVFTAAGLQEGETEEFSFTGEPQEFEVPEDGVYELRVWGAGTQATQGGTGPTYGGFAEGLVNLDQGDTLKIYVGGEGERIGGDVHSVGGGWNGGGDACDWNSGEQAAGGGGATDIRLDEDRLSDRIIVAGGGGGSTDNSGGEGGDGGGLQGEDGGSGYSHGEGGTQNSMGQIDNTPRGQGGECTDTSSGWTGGGGGGYYGGGRSADHGGSGGGSGHIDPNLFLDVNNTDDMKANMDVGANSGHGYAEIEFNEARINDLCHHRGPSEECIMNETSQLPAQQFNISSVFESRSNAVFEAFNDEPAVLQLENTTTISGLWTGNIQIESDRPRLEAGAEFRPEGERIVIGE